MTGAKVLDMADETLRDCEIFIIGLASLGSLSLVFSFILMGALLMIAGAVSLGVSFACGGLDSFNFSLKIGKGGVADICEGHRGVGKTLL